ncbi:XdhC family aldehyde oxidoreductase maturation factor [Desulfonatronum thiodismutans]|uniref:XdhC family aldehyde oxidoreductase maturation factor n=1 Tax=Desulfonatronum thiodismutans TaxID=159290 RepID=UPI000689C1D6|nr:XdhC/CoxI family protein [Desulfonatronum thiodismutans]
MIRLEDEILTLLEAGDSAALATIVGQTGSAPRTPGTRMVVRRDGSILGTVGGGRLEAEVIQTGLDVLRSGFSRLQHFTLAGTDAGDMDMICGGELDVLVEPLRPVTRTIELFRLLARRREQEGEWLLATVIRESADGRAGLLSESYLLQRSASGLRFYPEQPDSPERLASLLESARTECGPTLYTSGSTNGNTVGESRVVIELIRAKETVHLFGAGHVSREVALLAHRVDFRVEVHDDRSDFANPERFPMADAVHVPENMGRAFEGRRIDENSYVVIVTRGHTHDMDVLAQALRTQAAYIGMIGSRRKRDAIYAALRGQGFSQDDLSGVHCPIGLDINAQTPAEIALSIVAELVKIRAIARSSAKACKDI